MRGYFHYERNQNFPHFVSIFSFQESLKDPYDVVLNLSIHNAHVKNFKDEDPRIKAYIELFNIFSKYKITDLRLFAKSKLASLYFDLKMDKEAANCLVEICEFINCNHELPDEKTLLMVPYVSYEPKDKAYRFKGSEFKTGRELHLLILQRAISLLKSQKQYRECLLCVEQIKKTVIIQFKHYEEMIDILKIEASIYRDIALDPSFTLVE